MKKFVCGLLALVILIMSVACSDKAGENQEITAAESEVVTVESSEELTTAEETAEPYTCGTVVDGYYFNEYFGITLSLDSSFRFATESEIEQITKTAVEKMGIEYKSNEDYMDLVNLEHAEMIATNSDSGIQIVSTLFDDKTREKSAKIADENEELVSAEAIYESLGLTDASHEYVEKEISGQKCRALFIKGTIQNRLIYHTAFYFINNDELLTIVFTSLNPDMDKMISGLYVDWEESGTRCDINMGDEETGTKNG